MKSEKKQFLFPTPHYLFMTQQVPELTGKNAVLKNYLRMQSLFYSLIKNNSQILHAAQKVYFAKGEEKTGGRISMLCMTAAKLPCYKTVHRNTKFGLTRS